MPGRPKHRLKQFEKIELAALELRKQLLAATPKELSEKYVADFDGDADPPTDDTGKLWWEALEATTNAAWKVEGVGDYLRKKAGIAEGGPITQALEQEEDEVWRKQRAAKDAEKAVEVS